MQEFTEDWTSLPVGPIGGDYSPAGEYHLVPAHADQCRWRETTIDPSWVDSPGNWQIVLEADGRRVLEQTYSTNQCMPTLAAEGPAFEDASLTCSLRPLTLGGWRGVLFRYIHSRRWYAAAFEDGKAMIVRRVHDDWTTLAEAPCELTPDRWSELTIALVGPQIILHADDLEVLRCSDDSQASWTRGTLGFAASNLTRFGAVGIEAEAWADGPNAYLHPPQPRVVSRSGEGPQPRVWRRIDPGTFGTDRNLRVGDVNGDGQNEIVLARPTDRIDKDAASDITSLAAFTLDGEMLWALGETGRRPRHTTADLCFQVHDIDGDGRAEIIYAKDWQLIIADGATGETRRAVELPRPIQPHPSRPYRIYGDSICFTDLQGTGRRDCILLKDRYRNFYAYDAQLSPLWQIRTNIGHYPHPRTVSGDLDEIAVGYALLGPDGVPRWDYGEDIIDHADNTVIVDLDVEADGDRQPCVLTAGSDAGLFLHTVAGRRLGHFPIGHAQSLCVARLLPDSEGLQILCNTFWHESGAHVLFDEGLCPLAEFEPVPYAGLLQPVNWVSPDGDGRTRDGVLLSTHPRQGGLIDGLGRRLVSFPGDGHPFLCCDARDIDGDGIDEVLTWNEQELWIYKADVPGRDTSNYPHRQPWYNDSNYRAQLSLPGDLDR